MATLIEIKWYVAEDGSGHVTKFVHHGRGVTEKTYVFDSLSRRDQLPPSARQYHPTGWTHAGDGFVRDGIVLRHHHGPLAREETLSKARVHPARTL